MDLATALAAAVLSLLAPLFSLLSHVPALVFTSPGGTKLRDATFDRRWRPANPPFLPIFGRDFRQCGGSAADMPISAGFSDGANAAEITIDGPMEPEPVSFAVTNGSNGLAQDALRRCAAGEITPELALSQLLQRVVAAHEVEAALGAAIWDALESRATAAIDRLANLQRLWNRRQRAGCDRIGSIAP